MSNDEVVYYVMFDELVNMKEVTAGLIEKYGTDEPVLQCSSSGNGCVLGVSKMGSEITDTTYELYLDDFPNREIDKDLFNRIFNALPNKEYSIRINKSVYGAGEDYIGTWEIDVFTDADFNPLPLIRVSGIKELALKVLDEYRPEIPEGKWYSDCAGIIGAVGDGELSSGDISALLRKHRFD